MPSISNSYQWMIDVCNAPNIGYSQAYRNQETVDGITYYDCSSIIWYALLNGDFDCISANGGDSWPFTTYSMAGVLQTLGFTSVDVTGIWLPGDILIANPNIKNHTEMVYKERYTMGAHSSKPDLPDQVSIKDTPSEVPGSWGQCWRYGGGASGSYEWVYGEENEYLPEISKKNNASCIYRFFYYKGWTLNAIAGLCGNIDQESTFNPKLIEIGGTGHGLVQWTPPSDLYAVLDVLYGNHDDWWDGDKQLNVIYAEYEQSEKIVDRGIEPQWYKTPEYPISWGEWATSNESPEYLAMAFEYNYERPAQHHPERQELARKWYDYLKGQNPWIPPVIDTTFHKMPLYMFLYL